MDAVASNAVLGLSAAAPALGMQSTLPLGTTVNSAVVAGNYLNVPKKVPLLPTPGIVLPMTTAQLQPPQIVSHPVLGSQGTITVPLASAQNFLTTPDITGNARNFWQGQKSVTVQPGEISFRVLEIYNILFEYLIANF